jgi:hypothetical protein
MSKLQQLTENINKGMEGAKKDSLPTVIMTEVPVPPPTPVVEVPVVSVTPQKQENTLDVEKLVKYSATYIMTMEMVNASLCRGGNVDVKSVWEQNSKFVEQFYSFYMKDIPKINF